MIEFPRMMLPSPLAFTFALNSSCTKPLISWNEVPVAIAKSMRVEDSSSASTSTAFSMSINTLYFLVIKKMFHSKKSCCQIAEIESGVIRMFDWKIKRFRGVVWEGIILKKKEFWKEIRHQWMHQWQYCSLSKVGWKLQEIKTIFNSHYSIFLISRLKMSFNKDSSRAEYSNFLFAATFDIA